MKISVNQNPYYAAKFCLISLELHTKLNVRTPVPALTVHRPPKQGMQGNGVHLTPVCRSGDAQLLAERLQPELHAAAHSAMERGGPFSPPDPPYRYPAARHPALLIYCYTGFHN